MRFAPSVQIGMLVLLVGGLLLGAIGSGGSILQADRAFAQGTPTIGDIQANPAQYYDQVVTLAGTLDLYTDENDFVLADSTGRIAVDAGPEWYTSVNIAPGSTLSVTGQVDILRNGSADLDACRIMGDGINIDIRDCSFRGPPPWAGGPRGNGRGGDDGRGGGRGGGRDDDDDFYGIIESRPAGTAGTWVISGRSITATEQTRLMMDDGALNVGTCVSVELAGSTAQEIESEYPSDCAGNARGGGDDGLSVGSEWYSIIRASVLR